MKSTRLCRPRNLLVASLSFALGGCAFSIPEADPADIPRLEEMLTADPENTTIQVQLGMAQFKGEDFEVSRGNLQAAVDGGNESGPALLYLGLVQEELEEWSAARDAYSRYLDVGRSAPLIEVMRQRLQLIAQRVLAQQAQAALAAESQLADTDVTPRSVAVFPFRYESNNPDYEPLIYALADMMTTDFAVSNALIVLERAQIQSLLNEMALTDAGYAEPGTGARAGRMLQAEHVVQGVLTTLGQDELQILTDVLNVPNATSAGVETASDELVNLFDMEKDLVFRIIRDRLGVQLTPAEEQAILDNRTDNVLAFLAYGRGLRQKDDGNYSAAQAEFEEAQSLDPDFDAAAAEAVETGEIALAETTTTAQIVTTAATTGETGSSSAVAAPTTTTTGAADAASSSSSSGSDAGAQANTGTTGGTGSTAQTLAGASQAVNPTPTSNTIDLGSTQASENNTTAQASQTRNDAVQESQNQENVASTTQAQIRIVIKRPGRGGTQ